MTRRFEIDPDIGRAETPPAGLYREPADYALQVERVLERSWHVLERRGVLPGEGWVHPATLLPGSLDEPLVLTRAGGEVRCLSNTCTHRGATVVEAPGACRRLRCPYHGRRFGLDGRFEAMPGFEGVLDFPSPRDDLASYPLAPLGPLWFSAVAPALGFDRWAGPLVQRLSFLPLDDLVFESARDYVFDANWLLWVDNYLEGFHIPWVHPELARTLDPRDYRIETFEHGSLQVGVATEGPAFEPPEGHPDAGTRVGGYYAFLFPTTALNFYPWGLSVNLVHPLGPGRTRIRYLSFVHRPELREAGAGADLHRVELQDEAIVERVQRGLRGRAYRRGRYSPTHEVAVHHFHRLLAHYLFD